LLLQDHLTMSPCHVKQQEMILKTGKFSVSAKIRRSTKQPGLAVEESSKPELRPPEIRDRRLRFSGGLAIVDRVGVSVGLLSLQIYYNLSVI